MSLLSTTSRSVLRSSRTSILPSSRNFISNQSVRWNSSSSSSTSTSSSSFKSIQYLTLTLATFGLSSTLLTNLIHLDDSKSQSQSQSQSQSESKRKTYHERMAAQHKQAPIPTFAQQKAEELEELDEEQEGKVGEDGEEGEAQSAFDPSTGTINWDCPCLGGMADGPCGPQFKQAFSCFVFSEQEPKGIECVQKFKEMQDCFREYPEVYKEEIEDEERGLEEEKLEIGGEEKLEKVEKD